MESINYTDWGTIDYLKAYEQQKELFDQAMRDKQNQRSVKNTLIFCEHPPVITLGKSGDMQNLLFPETYLEEKGVSFYQIDRGGDVTFHGPGQLVGYPIFDLEGMQLGLKAYIHTMEEAIILLLADYGIKGERLAGATGVWLDTEIPHLARKICAVGVRSSRYITMHGFALNVSTDLSYFQLINPCGFIDRGVTSMEKELGKSINIEEIKLELLYYFKKKFDKDFLPESI